MPTHLQQKLLETVLVIGVDENSGLRTLSSSVNQESVSQNFYTASVLASLNESKAVYPFEYPPTDPNYPASCYTETTIATSSQTTTSNDEVNNGGGGKSLTGMRSVQDKITFEVRKQKSMCLRNNKVKSEVEPSIANDTIDGIPMLCFPNGVRVLKSPMDESVLNLVLTNIKGDRHYLTGLYVYRKYGYCSETKSLLCTKLSDCDSQENPKTSNRFVFVPCFICIISKYPYYSLFREVLSALHSSLTDSYEEFKSLMQKFSFSLTNVPVMNIGCRLILEFKLFNRSFKMFPALPILQKVVDYDLTLLFQALSIDNIIILVSALLQQKRIVVVSSSPAITTLCCDTLLLLLEPFHWKFTYVPYLPENLLEMLDAPGPVLYGCDAAYLENVESLDDIIVANLDTKQIIIPSSIEVFRPPESACNRLKTSLKAIKLPFDHYFYSSLEYQSMEILREKRAAFHLFNDKVILTAFVTFMVDLFRDVSFHLKNRHYQSHETFFNTESFLKAQTDARSFYESTTNSELFDSFLRDRLSAKTDCWAYIEEKSRNTNFDSFVRKRGSLLSITCKQNEESNLDGVLENFPNDLALDDSIDVNGLQPLLSDFDLKTCHIFNLPELLSEDFLKQVVSQINNCMLISEISVELQTNYLLLRINIQTALGNRIKALEDFHKLSKLDIKLIDKKQISSMMESLSRMELIHCSNTLYFNELKQLVQFDVTIKRQVSIDYATNRILKRFYLPTHPVLLDEFMQIVEDAEISSEADVSESLFRALSLHDKNSLAFKSVSPEIFSQFYQCWNRDTCDFDLTIDSSDFRENEIILKTSPVVRVDPIGNGRLILTQERLLMVYLGETDSKHLLQLEDIMSVSKEYAPLRFTTNSNTLKIHYKLNLRPKSLVIWLKNETNVWVTLLMEMSAAKLQVEEMKDSSLINKAIDQCMILNALFECAHTGASYFVTNLKEMIRQTVLFSNPTKTQYSLSRSTKQALISKIQSNPHLTKDNTVEAMACVNDKEVWASSIGDMQRSNRLVLINIETMKVDSEIPSMSKHRLMCMVYSGLTGTMWMGAQNHSIFVICIRERTLLQELTGHQDMLLSLAISEAEDMIASGSALGEVILWRTEDRTRITSWQLENNAGVLRVNIYDNRVFCCSHKAVDIFDFDGNSIATIPANQKNSTNCSSLHSKGFQCQCIFNDFLYIACARRSRVLVYSIVGGSPPSKVMYIKLPMGHCNSRTTTDDCKDCRTANKRCLKCTENRKCRGLSRVLVVGIQIWICCKDGNIFIYDLQTQMVCQIIQGHLQAIQSACTSQHRGLVFTGGRNHDGKIFVWNSKFAATAIDAESLLKISQSSVLPSISKETQNV